MSNLEVDLGVDIGEPSKGDVAPARLVFYSRKYGFKVYEQRKVWYFVGKRGRGTLHTDPNEVADVIAVVFGKKVAKRLARKLGVEVDIDV